jgi:hypothetical protein
VAGAITRSRDGGLWRVWAERRRGADAWARVAAPEPVLPAGVVEAFLWASWPRGPELTTVDVDDLRLGDGDAGRCTEGMVRPGDGRADAWDDEGRLVLRAEGLRWVAGAGARAARDVSAGPAADSWT